MGERDQSRLASVITLLLGIWIAISPIWLSVTGGTLVSMIVVGVVVAVFSIVQYFWENTAPSWIMGLAAVWLFIATFVFGTVTGGVVVSNVISAIALFILAYWDGAEVSQAQNHHLSAQSG